MSLATEVPSGVQMGSMQLQKQITGMGVLGHEVSRNLVNSNYTTMMDSERKQNNILRTEQQRR